MDNTSEQKTENQERKKIVRGPRLNQKLKIMYLMKILLEETDEDHDLTLNEIVEKLKAYSQELKEQVEAKDARLQKVGYQAY